MTHINLTNITRFFFIRNRFIRNSLSENPGPKKLSTSTIVLGSKVRKKLFRKKPRFGKILHRIFDFYYIKISKSVRNLTNSETVKKLLKNFFENNLDSGKFYREFLVFII